jgi:uncharacterized protein (TIGR03086 family)
MTDHLRTGWEVLDAALDALAAVTSGVGGQDWELPTPCEQWNVAQVLQHAVGDQAAWAAAVAGGPGPAENPFAPSGQLRDAPAAMVAQARRAAAGAWQGVRPDSGQVQTPLPVGALPAMVAAGACALDAGVHAWDLAAATGQPSPLTDPLARTLHDAATRVVEQLRGFAYGPALQPEPGDSEAAALLKYLGRRPDWKATG